MSEPVTFESLKATLRDRGPLLDEPFSVLRDISVFVDQHAEESLGIEIVLRALERRAAFGPFAGILDVLARKVGLFPYMQVASLSARDMVAYECHRPTEFDDIVFHRVQAQVYYYLRDGENIILSAPTSFGKSKIIDAAVASQRYTNVAIVVPTLALIDETRRRLAKLQAGYKLITHTSQEPADRNLFVLTAERVVSFRSLPHIDFFVIDEFYKLGAHHDQERMVALNEAFYRLRKMGGQFYLLGPSVKTIPTDAQGTLNARWIQTDFQTVVTEQHWVPGHGDKLSRLLTLCSQLTEPTIVYCASPARVNEVANALVAGSAVSHAPAMQKAAQWIGRHYHQEWILARALPLGVGIHHGKLPRSLGQLVVRAFNEGHVRFLICTSTLIEGVNTRAKNIIVFDNKIARKRVDFFTFNNIRGRAGRMFQHFIGNVYLFDEPPEEDLPFVDLPLVTQDKNTPTSLLMQLDDSDLRPDAAARMQELARQRVLPLEVLRANSGIDPELQIALANELRSLSVADARLLSWTGIPKSEELRLTCALIWDHLAAKAISGAKTWKQLAFKLSRLGDGLTVHERIADELMGPYAARSVDEAVERVLHFERSGAAFEMPKYLHALDRIQKHVLPQRRIKPGDYRWYAGRVESVFAAPILSALDEYGIPPPIGEKLLVRLKTDDDVDIALDNLRVMNVDALGLSKFESGIIADAQANLG